MFRGPKKRGDTIRGGATIRVPFLSDIAKVIVRCGRNLMVDLLEYVKIYCLTIEKSFVVIERKDCVQTESVTSNLRN